LFLEKFDKGENNFMPNRKRSKKELKQRRISDKSFKIWNPDGKLFAEMEEGKWIKKPEIKKNSQKKIVN